MSNVNDAYAVRKEAEVRNDTWGHLRPKADRTYNGFILYVQGMYGDIVCIASDFNGLTSSPWLYEDIHEFIGCNGEEDGKVYLWRGTYCIDRDKKFIGSFKNVSADTLRNHLASDMRSE